MQGPVPHPSSPRMPSSRMQQLLHLARRSLGPLVQARRPLAYVNHRNPFDFSAYELRGEDRSLREQLGEDADEVEEQQVKAEAGKEEVKAAALKLLSMRSHSRKELKLKLLDKGFAQDTIRAALDRLREVGLQSDTEFAEVFARSKWRQSRWGAARIRSELSRRGVDPALTAAAVEAVFGAEGLDVGGHLERLGDEDRDPGAAAAPEAALLQQARSRHALSGGLPEEARRRRLVGWLQRRGHKWADISQIMRQLEKEAAAAALDRLGDEGRGDDRSAASNWEEEEERL